MNNSRLQDINLNRFKQIKKIKFIIKGKQRTQSKITFVLHVTVIEIWGCLYNSIICNSLLNIQILITFMEGTAVRYKVLSVWEVPVADLAEGGSVEGLAEF